MKTLHLTNHVGTIKNISNVFAYLNLSDDLTTENVSFPLYIDFDMANLIWENCKEIVKNYKCLIFTDTSMYARPFLQNIDQHDLIIIVYITNRFDFGAWTIEMRNEISTLYSSMSKHERVFFCSDNRYDKYYASLYGIEFSLNDIVRLTPKINNEMIIPNNEKFFIHYRGNNIENYSKYLEDRDIKYDFFDENNRYIDENHICEYVGFLHLPYQVNIQSLWENLGYSVIYFIPSKTFLKELLKTDWYYFEEKFFTQGKLSENELLDKSIELAEWYQPENECMFEYFESWDDLNYKFSEYKNNNSKLIEKKKTIKDNVEKSNIINIEKWKNLLV